MRMDVAPRSVAIHAGERVLILREGHDREKAMREAKVRRCAVDGQVEVLRVVHRRADEGRQRWLRGIGCCAAAAVRRRPPRGCSRPVRSRLPIAPSPRHPRPMAPTPESRSRIAWSLTQAAERGGRLLPLRRVRADRRDHRLLAVRGRPRLLVALAAAARAAAAAARHAVALAATVADAAANALAAAARATAGRLAPR